MNKEAGRMAEVPFSGIRKIFEEAKTFEDRGAKVIHLELGRPDFDSPENVKAAAKHALDQGMVHYTSNYGIPALRRAIAEKLERDNGLKYDPEGEIIVTVGIAEGIFLALAAFLDPGDEILTFDPSFLNYHVMPRFLGAKVVSVPLLEERGFQPDPDDVARAITPRTKMMAVITPHNPTGAVVKKEVLRDLAALAVKHDLMVISDEIYEKIIYDGAEHVSIASFPGMRERTIVLNGFSKAYSMTGWRLAYAAAPREFIGPMVRIHQYLVSSATSFAQYAGITALREAEEAATKMVAEFKRRRDVLVDALNDIPGVSCVRPEGAFYTFPNVKSFGKSSNEIALELLRKAQVAVVPGSAFGKQGEGYLRVSYASSYQDILEGIERMKKFFASL